MPVFRINPFVARLLPKLITQLVPAALVTALGVMLLSNLGKTPSAAPDTPPVEVAINADSVFKITPREPVDDRDQDVGLGKTAGSKPAVKPKPLAANTVAPQSRKANEPAPRQVASAPAPLPIVQIPEQPQTSPARTPSSDNAIVSSLRSATTTVQRIPQWAARSVAGWFTEGAPPRPPAPVPTRNFQAAM
jgi:hypothetical protein